MPPPIVYTHKLIQKQWVNNVQANVVTRAVATLTAANMKGGSGPDGNIIPPGWYNGSCPSHHNRGHLIGKDLGGPGNNANNLVTLTSGTNHPIMYEFEYAAKAIVNKFPTKSFIYTVSCEYDDYTPQNGFPIPGASGNPFCIFPAPATLILSLQEGANLINLGTLAQYFPTPPSESWFGCCLY